MTRFFKMHANGNDFMMIDACHNAVSNISTQDIQKWSNRQTGIGFDQLLLIYPPRDRQIEAKCRIFNADGSEAGQCGHGIACVAKWLYTRRYTENRIFRIATIAGVWLVQLMEDGQVKVNLGEPIWRPKHIPFLSKQAQQLYQLSCPSQVNNVLKQTYIDFQKQQLNYLKNLQQQLILQSKILHSALDLSLEQHPSLLCGILALGNPHCVIPINNIDDVPVALGRLLSEHPAFPQGTNVTFMHMLSPKHIVLKVYERGVGFNRACGSAACAAVIVGRVLGYLEAAVNVEFISKDQVSVFYNDLQSPVQLQTQTHFVFKGQILLDEQHDRL